MGKLKLRFPIRVKLILLIAAVLVNAILIVSIFYYTNAKSVLEKRILSDLTVLAKSKADQVNELLQQDFERTVLLSSRIKLREKLFNIQDEDVRTKENIVEINSMLKKIADSITTIGRIDIFGPHGEIMASSSFEDIGRDMSKTKEFTEGRKVLYLSELYSEKGALMYNISAPLSDPIKEKEIIGVIKVVIPAIRLLRIINDFSGLGDTGELNLGKREGEDILFLNSLRHKPDSALKYRVPIESELSEPMERAISGKKGIVIGLDYRGVKVLAAYTHVELTKWGLVAKIDIKEAFAPIEKLRRQTMLISCLVLVLNSIVAVIFSRLISVPIRKLREGTNIIAKGNLDYRVNVSTNDEIGQLSASFNQMAENLKKITASRDELNREIEKRRKIEGELRQALNIKSDFISTVSHELRTPLAAIREGIIIVLDGSTGTTNEEQKRFLSLAKRNVDRLARLINDVLDFQKLEFDGMVFNMQEGDINEAVNETRKAMSSLADNKGIDFVLKLDNNLPKIKFDKDKITQLLANLVNNAIKFTPQGSIAVSSKRGDNFIQISIEDTGPGIKEEDMPKLFQEFSQLERDAERKTGGTGLGLAICRKIIEKRRGKIWAESEFGRGTTMHFVLPVQERRT